MRARAFDPFGQRDGATAAAAAPRLAVAAVLAFMLPMLAGGPASAQFVCTVTPTDSTCTNAGTAAGTGNLAVGPAQNATTTNGGTNTGGFAAQTSGGGNATATNNGNNSGAFTAQTSTGGDASATNNGNSSGNFSAQTFGGGNATATNAGTNSGFFAAHTSAGGNASATNSGSNNGGFAAQTFNGGNATATNNGNNTGGFSASTINGTATGINTGTNANGFGVNSLNGDAIATNSGVNNGGIGVTAINGNAIMTSSGTNTAGIGANSILSGNATVTNSGTNSAGIGVNASGSGNATVVNSGTNSGGISVIASQGNASATNSGSNSGNLQVMSLSGGSASLVNSGLTSGTAFVIANGGPATLTNSGTISNFGGNAVILSGSPDTLNLLTGSKIIGDIVLGGSNDAVNFLGGNHNLTFAGPGLAAATVGGAIPFAVSGNQAAAVDPTPFGLADKNLMDFTRAISSILGSLGGTSAAPNGPISLAFAPADTLAARLDDTFASLGSIPALAYAGDAMAFKNPTMVDQSGRSVWARGFGGEHVQDADGPLLRSTTEFMGGAVGFDVVARPDLRLGLFAGAGQSRLSLDLNQGRTDTNTAFGGLSGRWGFVSFGAPSFLDFALHGGGSSNSTSRNIDNNTLASGLETATASYNSWYLSPEIAYGVNLALGSEYTLTPSLRVRYVAGFFDGYTEAGTTAPLTVASRTIQDVEERGELKLTRAQRIGPDTLLTSLYVGALGIERAGDTTLNTVLLGASLPFVTPGKNSVAGVLGGGGLEWRTREGISFFGAAEAIGMSDQGTVISARGGIRAAF